MQELAVEERMKAEQEQRHRLEVDWQNAEMRGEKISLSALVTVTIPRPEQDELLPHIVEMVCEDSGQEFKRIIYKQAIELADYELVMTKRGGKEGKGIQLIGKARYTFKTIFGTVRVYRIRIRHK